MVALDVRIEVSNTRCQDEFPALPGLSSSIPRLNPALPSFDTDSTATLSNSTVEYRLKLFARTAVRKSAGGV